MKKHTAVMCALVLGASLCGWFAPSFAAGERADAPQAVHQPGLGERAQIWIDTRLGRKTVKDYHRKVHQNGTNCELCHAANNPTTAPDDRNCLKCHGTREQVAQLTAKLEHNPHNSPHYGTDAPCTTCHREHEESRVYCNSCHPFKFENFKK